METKHILLVEDNGDITELLRTLFENNGYRFTALAEADDIVSTVRELRPELIITDYILEGINGGEYCSALKRGTDTAHLPVIILSGYGKLLGSLGDYGADRIIEKPFDNDELISAVSSLLAVSH